MVGGDEVVVGLPHIVRTSSGKDAADFGLEFRNHIALVEAVGLEEPVKTHCCGTSLGIAHNVDVVEFRCIFRVCKHLSDSEIHHPYVECGLFEHKVWMYPVRRHSVAAVIGANQRVPEAAEHSLYRKAV